MEPTTQVFIPVVKPEYHPNPVCLTIHTNFDVRLHEGLQVVIEAMEGVERISWSSSKYHISVEIGLVFDIRDMAHKIEQKIIEYFKD